MSAVMAEGGPVGGPISSDKDWATSRVLKDFLFNLMFDHVSCNCLHELTKKSGFAIHSDDQSMFFGPPMVEPIDLCHFGGESIVGQKCFTGMAG